MGKVLVNVCALSVLVTERPLYVENMWALDISKPSTVIPDPAVKVTVPPPVLWGVRVNLLPTRLAVVLANMISDKLPGIKHVPSALIITMGWALVYSCESPVVTKERPVPADNA